MTFHSRSILGYWTANGAFYYYNTIQGLNYEDTLIELANYFKAQDIPIRYMDIDSWWYFKGNTFTP